MKIFWWFIAGCLFVGVPFIFGYEQTDLWRSVIFGAMGGTLYLLFLFFVVIKKTFSLKENVLVGSLFIIFILAFTAYTVNMYRMTSYQRGLLSVIRTYIGSSSIISSELHDRAIPVLYNYYSQSKENRHSIVESFKNMNNGSVFNGEMKPRPSSAQIRTFVFYQGDSLVRLVSIDTVAYGLKDDFVNIGGYCGKLQYTATISKHGALYERNN